MQGNKHADDQSTAAVEKHDVAIEDKHQVDNAEKGQEAVALDDDHACLAEREAAAPKAQGDKPNTEAQERGEHRQAAVMREHRGKEHGCLIPHVAGIDAAEVLAVWMGGGNPPSADVG